MTLNNKIVLITGGTGSLGTNIIKKLFDEGCEKIKIFSRDEFKHEAMQKKFSEYNIDYYIGDIRDAERLNLAFKNVDIVIHAAAIKSINACTYNPMEAVKTNVVGTQNVIKACVDSDRIQRAIFISTDKAVEPINFYGATKMIAEKSWLSSNVYKPIFNVVRYGNVNNSNGSVIKCFLEINKDEKSVLPITNIAATRFSMTYNDAFDLIQKSIVSDSNDRIFIKIPESYVMKYFIDYFNKNYLIIGLREGEKLHEILLNTYEERKYLCCDKSNKILIEPEGRTNFKGFSSKDNIMSYEKFVQMMDSIVNEGR